MLRREIVTTADGSASIRLPDWDESYHSKHGAVQEARHVFIKNGLDLFNGPVSILEMGFGTGLNALITFGESRQRNMEVHYTGVDAYPVTPEEARQLNYPDIVGYADAFARMHDCPWEQEIDLNETFSLTKRQMDFLAVDYREEFNLIYFDAFGYRFQPDLWSAEIFESMFRALTPGGVLVTYAARTAIKKNMESAGFAVEKLAGPPGKREMMRARKPN